ncbi:MAG: flagellar biosynthesis protein FlhF [Planctomycetota bacterium]
MEVRTYRAVSMHEALALVRRELGPDAAILHTREVQSRRLFGWLSGPRQIEVTASSGVQVASRLPVRTRASEAETPVVYPLGVAPGPVPPAICPPAAPPRITTPEPVSEPMQGQLNDLHSMVKELCRRTHGGGRELPEELFRLFAELIDADLSEDLARDLVERVRVQVPAAELGDRMMLQARVARIVEGEIQAAGPIRVTPGRRRLVALVGPTGVGKTTTIAKLAAIYRLKEKRRVGLITVDTYRIAAVEQLRTYADIIDLPMQVVSTPREMREAARRMDDLDLVLLDTAGRSPKDEVKIQELKAFLSEAAADEVHVVLSSVASGRTLEQTAERFTEIGATALLLTKLDEAPSLGHILPLLRHSRLPLSYLTNGQNVPDDIEIASAPRLSRIILGRAEK